MPPPFCYRCLPLNFCLYGCQRKFSKRQFQCAAYLMFASSLLILFSSSSLALAFLRSAMNCTSPSHPSAFAPFPTMSCNLHGSSLAPDIYAPLIFELPPPLPLPRNPAAALLAIISKVLYATRPAVLNRPYCMVPYSEFPECSSSPKSHDANNNVTKVSRDRKV